MAFQSYLCWDTSGVRKVLNTDAEYASRHIFLAVHSEFPLRATNPRPREGGGGDTRWTIQPQEFLQAFLSRDGNAHAGSGPGGLRRGQVPFYQLDEIQPAAICRSLHNSNPSYGGQSAGSFGTDHRRAARERETALSR